MAEGSYSIQHYTIASQIVGQTWMGVPPSILYFHITMTVDIFDRPFIIPAGCDERKSRSLYAPMVLPILCLADMRLREIWDKYTLAMLTKETALQQLIAQEGISWVGLGLRSTDLASDIARMSGGPYLVKANRHFGSFLQSLCTPT